MPVNDSYNQLFQRTVARERTRNCNKRDSFCWRIYGNYHETPCFAFFPLFLAIPSRNIDTFATVCPMPTVPPSREMHDDGIFEGRHFKEKEAANWKETELRVVSCSWEKEGLRKTFGTSARGGLSRPQTRWTCFPRRTPKRCNTSRPSLSCGATRH